MSGIDKDVASGVLNTIGIGTAREDTSKDEYDGNILDDILNTGDEKFEDDDMMKGAESVADDIDDDDGLSLEDHDVGKKEILGSDISSNGEDSGDGDEHSDISASEKNSDTEDNDEEIDNAPRKKIKKEKSSSEQSDQGENETETVEKKKKGKKYDYATKLNYLFRDARFFLVKSNNAENVALAKVFCFGHKINVMLY